MSDLRESLFPDLRYRSAIMPYSVPEHFRLSTEEFFALMDAAVLLGRLNQWDALNPPRETPYADAPYWKAEIERVLAPLGDTGLPRDHAEDEDTQ